MLSSLQHLHAVMVSIYTVHTVYLNTHIASSRIRMIATVTANLINKYTTLVLLVPKIHDTGLKIWHFACISIANMCGQNNVCSDMSYNNLVAKCYSKFRGQNTR